MHIYIYIIYIVHINDKRTRVSTTGDNHVAKYEYEYILHDCLGRYHSECYHRQDVRVNSNANGSKTFKVPESLTKHNLWQNCWTLDCSLLWTWSPHVFQHRLQHHRISQVQKDVLQPGSIIGCQNVMSKEVWITFPNFSPALNPQWSKKTCPFAIAGNLDLGGAATFLSDFDPKLMDFHLHFNAPSHETNRKEIDRSIKQQQTYNPILDWNYSVLIPVVPRKAVAEVSKIGNL